MTEQQRQNLENVANALRSGYTQISESFAIGQIMCITGRPYDKAIEGLKLMRREKLLDGFIDPRTDGALARMTQRNPVLEKFLKKFDCVPGKTEIIDFQGFIKPKPVDRVTLEKRFALPEF